MSPSRRQSQRADFPVLWPVSTRWDDEDVYGHVNNVAFYAFFDTAVNGWLMRATGVDLRRLPAVGLVAETGCRFHREVGFPEPVEVGVGVERLGTSSVVYRLAVFQGSSELAAADGRFVHVYVDRKTREVCPLPDPVREAVTTLG